MRTQLKDWELCFASGGLAALHELAISPCDVVVTDMRMAGMDGAELLERVRDQYPGSYRIILSGQSDSLAQERTLAVCHRYRSKPCDPAVLRQTIEQACREPTCSST